MKKSTTLIISIFAFLNALTAQDITELTQLYNWDDPNIVGSSFYDNKYNEVWGFVQDGIEYGVIGSTDGTHFFDISDPSLSSELDGAFVEGKVTGGIIIHRDYHDYNGYLYAVADEGPSSLQIIKLDGLPASTEVVYDSDQLLRRAHNIFIDTSSALLYAMGVGTFNGGYSMKILSLEDPENPVELSSLPSADLNLPYVHDGYIENGIGFFNCGYSGLYMIDFSEPTNPVLMGVLEDYQDNGYNHSGWPHETADIYYLADENHGLRIKVIDYSEPNSMEVVNFIDAETEFPEESIPHNLIVMDNYLYVSYYFDGVQVYDVTDAANPVRVAQFDTYPIVDFTDDYNGNWGVYPFPGSKKLVASDMRNGFFLFDSVEEVLNSSKENKTNTLNAEVFPIPFVDRITIKSQDMETGTYQLSLVTVNGKRFPLQTLTISTKSIEKTINIPTKLPEGMYILLLEGENINYNKKIFK